MASKATMSPALSWPSSSVFKKGCTDQYLAGYLKCSCFMKTFSPSRLSAEENKLLGPYAPSLMGWKWSGALLCSWYISTLPFCLEYSLFFLLLFCSLQFSVAVFEPCMCDDAEHYLQPWLLQMPWPSLSLSNSSVPKSPSSWNLIKLSGSKWYPLPTACRLDFDGMLATLPCPLGKWYTTSI